jgi:hypothetical protein
MTDQLPQHAAHEAARKVASAIRKGDEAWALDNLGYFLPPGWTLPTNPMAVEFAPHTVKAMTAAYRRYAVRRA